MHTSIYSGGTLVLMPRWDRDLAGRMISLHKVTNWTNVPTMIIDLLASPHFAQFDLTSLVYIGGGGAAMPQAVAQRLLDQYGLRYAEGYGLTETAAPSHSNPPDAPKQQCLGIPFMSTDARVVDPDTLAELPVGEQGEIIVHGPEVFEGYWQRPDATQAVFIEKEGKRFFRTGDLGHVDADGYFFLTDRLKRMINASGFKVWPAEVEALMFRHPAIQEACVIGVRDALHGGGNLRRQRGRLTTGDGDDAQRFGRGIVGLGMGAQAQGKGRLQGAPHCAGGGCLAQERQWQGDVAGIAGGAGVCFVSAATLAPGAHGRQQLSFTALVP